MVEVFGDEVEDGTAEVGSGIHPFRDPALTEEFSAPRRGIDVSQWHRYAVEWSASGVRWLVDGVETGRSTQSPDYPRMLILGVFDFLAGSSQRDSVPELVVREVTWSGGSG